jgi:hypothetical protein
MGDTFLTSKKMINYLSLRNFRMKLRFDLGYKDLYNHKTLLTFKSFKISLVSFCKMFDKYNRVNFLKLLTVAKPGDCSPWSRIVSFSHIANDIERNFIEFLY